MSTSPVPQQSEVPVLINFHQALDAALAGSKVGRVSWAKDEYIYVGDTDDFLMIHTMGKFHRFAVRRIDMEGVDYFVIQ